ncbi:MAG: hypothetical protein RLZZ628_1567 [Bacteroidota bacterium]|jgi:hypothetical protein
MRNIKCYWASIFLLCHTASKAQLPSQAVYSLRDTYVPAYAMRVFTGSASDTTFQSVQSQIIQRLNRDSNDLRIMPDSLMWLRFVFKNETNDSIWRLTTENNNIRQMLLLNKFGQVIDSGGYSMRKMLKIQATDSKKDSLFKTMLSQHTHLYFHLSLGQTDTFFLLINNPQFRTATYLHLDHDEKLRWNVALGYESGKMEMMLFIYVLFTLTLIFLGRARLYFYYFLYILGVYFYYVASGGLGFWLYWNRIDFEAIAFLLGSVWAMTAFFLVLREFLELKVKIPILNKIIVGIIGCGFSLIVLILLNLWKPILPLRQWVYDGMNLLFLIGLLLILVSLLSGRLQANHKRENWLFIFAIIPIFLSSLSILCCELDITRH